MTDLRYFSKRLYSFGYLFLILFNLIACSSDNNNNNNTNKFTQPVPEECVESVQRKIKEFEANMHYDKNLIGTKLKYISFSRSLLVYPRLAGYLDAEIRSENYDKVMGYINAITGECLLYSTAPFSVNDSREMDNFLVWLEAIKNDDASPYVILENDKLKIIYRNKALRKKFESITN